MADLKRGLSPFSMIGAKVYYFDRIDSTNDYAKSLINTAPEGTVILADQQTRGKGRHGRTWYSPADGIWMSVILRPQDASLLTVAAGVAACEALHAVGVVPGMKWPNDIVLKRKKIGGILTEYIDKSTIVGIGINLNMRKFPPELKNVASSVLIETKKRLDKERVYAILCRQLDSCYSMLKNRQTSELLTQWRHYSIMLGREVYVEAGDKKVTGRVLDISRDGALMLMCPDKCVERIIGGVCHLTM